MAVVKIKCTECGRMIPKTELSVAAEVKRHWGVPLTVSVTKHSILAQERIDALKAKLTAGTA